jgi:WD40 repeat protein
VPIASGEKQVGRSSHGSQRLSTGGGVMTIDDLVETTYEVFLSYNSRDREIVRELAGRLREEGIEPWFDKDALGPGLGWQDQLAARLKGCGACAVFVGGHGIAGWERNEMELALDRATRDHDFRVFAVLLPGIDVFDSSVLPDFLALREWVDVRADPSSPESIQSIINAARGAALRPPVAVTDGRECPYRGLEVFEEEHAPYFFGRQAQVQRLLETLRQGRFLAVVGQSGVGKSSLVRAGLLARLRMGALPGSARWAVLRMRPGVLPMTTLREKLRALGESVGQIVDRHGTYEQMLNDVAVAALVDEPDSKLVIVVDQFEELYTTCRDAQERAAFLKNLRHAATYPDGPVVVVVAMRSDFYSRLAQYPAFAQLAQWHQVHVPPMQEEELRDVILEPAAAVGMKVERGLAKTILAEVARMSGTLPFLEHALLETWRHRAGNTLTLEGYRATGGVRHALGERAETVYSGLSDVVRERAREVFLRLIQPGEGTEDTRRRVPISEITASDAGPTAEAVRRFVDAFLLTTSADEMSGVRSIEIAHEAVIAGWQRCAAWVNDSRADLLVHRRLTVAADEWKRRGRSPDVLYRGVPLAEALAWRARGSVRLNWVESDFLDAADTHARAQFRSRRRRYAGGVVALLTALIIIAVVAVVAVVQRNIATSRQLAAEATKALTVDPALSLALALRAEDVAQTSQADEALREATAQSHGLAVLANPGGSVYGVRLLPDGEHAVTASEDGAVRIWDLGSTTPPLPMAQHTGRIFTVRVSPDGRTVASVGLDGALLLTTVATGASRPLWITPEPISSVEFSHDGQVLAALLGDGSVHLIDAATGQERALPLATGSGIAVNASFSPDDALLVTATTDGTAQVWRLSDGARLRVFPGDGPMYWAEFSPSGRMVAVAGEDGKVRLWDPDTGELLREIAASGAALYVARFSRDGERIAAAGQDGAVTLWDLDGLELATLRGHSGKVFDVDFGPSSDTLVSAGNDATIRTWATADDVHVRAQVTTATLDEDGTRVASGGTDGRLRIWRLPDLAPVLDIPDHTGRSQALFSSDGRHVITYGSDGVVAVRDSTDGRQVAAFAPDVGVINSVAADPTDQRLVVGGDSGRLSIVDNRGAVVESLTTGGSPVLSASFSPDGRSVVAGRFDGSITSWGPDRMPRTVRPSNFRAVYDLDFDTEGTLLAVADASGSIDIWDPEGRQVAVLLGHAGPVSAVRYRRDGEQLVSSGADGTVRVWDTRTYEQLTTFPAADGSASFVDFSPDGRTIVKSAENQHALRLLACDLCGTRDAVLQRARTHAFRTLTADEERRFSAPR